MIEWRWVAMDTVLAAHDWALAEHGGMDGLRDQGLLTSALARPQNPNHYGDPDAAALAAAYAFSLARNHGFLDGNKRIGWLAARVFLLDNGFRLRFEHIDAVRAMEAVAGGSMGEEELGEWFRQRLEWKSE